MPSKKQIEASILHQDRGSQLMCGARASMYAAMAKHSSPQMHTCQGRCTCGQQAANIKQQIANSKQQIDLCMLRLLQTVSVPKHCCFITNSF